MKKRIGILALCIDSFTEESLFLYSQAVKVFDDITIILTPNNKRIYNTQQINTFVQKIKDCTKAKVLYSKMGVMNSKINNDVVIITSDLFTNLKVS